jgi:hypothetical protein
VLPEELCQLKNSNDTIGNRTRDFPTCSAVTALIDSYLPTFRDNLSVLSSTVNLSQKNAFLKFADGDDRLSQKSLKDYQLTLTNN